MITTRNPFIYDVLGMTIPNLVTEQGSSMTKFHYSSWMTGLGVNPFVQLWQSRRNRHRNVVNFVIEVKLSSFTVEVPPVSQNFRHKSEIKKKYAVPRNRTQDLHFPSKMAYHHTTNSDVLQSGNINLLSVWIIHILKKCAVPGNRTQHPSLRVKLPYHQNTTLVMLRDEFFSYSFIESVLWLKPNPIVLPPDPNPTQIRQRAGVGSPLVASLSDGQLRRTALAA